MSNCRINLRIPKGSLRKTLGNSVGELLEEVYPGTPDLAVEQLDNKQTILDTIARLKRLRKLCLVMFNELTRIKERRCTHCSHGADQTLKELF